MTEVLDMGVRNPDFVENSDEVPSNFISGTAVQFAWDSTSLGDFKRCPQLYKYKYIDGWRSKEENIHQRFGGEYHQCMADYQKEKAAGIPHDDAVFDVVKALMFRINDWRPEHKYKNRLNLLQCVIGYLDAHENDKVQVVLKNDGTPMVELSFRFEIELMCTADQPYVLCGHMDDIVKFNSDYFVRDHKTGKETLNYAYWKKFEPHNQMTLYTIASRVVLEKPAKGVIIDANQVLLTHPFTEQARGMTYRTEEQLEEWMGDLEMWLNTAEFYATSGRWPKNEESCHHWGGCPFRDVCASTPAVRDTMLQSDFEKGEIWNPLKPR
jgi:hypothetical protein